MDQLIEEYRGALKFINNLRLRAETYHIDTKEKIIVNISEDDYKMLGKYICSLQYSIDYMRTGRVPGNRRGIYRQSKDKRTISVDPNNLDYLRNVASKENNAVQFDAEQEQLIAEFLDMLSHQEREAFKMVRIQGLSFGETAKLMKIAKGTVQDYVKQAEKKLAAIVQKPEDRDVFVQRIMFSEVV